MTLTPDTASRLVAARRALWILGAVCSVLAIAVASSVALFARDWLYDSRGAHVFRGPLLCSVPDVDGDGVADIACASPSRERVWVLSSRGSRVLCEFAGSANPARCIVGGLEADEPVVWARSEGSLEMRSARTGQLRRSLEAAVLDELRGAPLARVSDRDGDGVADLALGDPSWSHATDENRGRIAVRSSRSGDELLVIRSPSAGARTRSWFADRVLEGPDVDGDGTPDLFATSRAESGRQLRLLSGLDGAALASAQEAKSKWGDFASAIDWRDAWPDHLGPVLLLSDPRDIPSWVEVRSLRAPESLLRIENTEANARFGAAARFFDDVDRDGCPELAIGVPGPPKGASLMGLPLPSPEQLAQDSTRGGRVELRSGRTGQVLWTARGDADWDWFGADLLALPDVDGDGLADLAVAGESGFNRRERVPTLTILAGATGAVLSSTRLE